MNKRILLCDDEITILKAAEFKLTSCGFEVECANDGLAGWEAIQRQRPDLLVTDCQMPRMNGLELIERVRSIPELQTLPIFMLTGKGFELSQEELAKKWNVIEVLGKPFSPRELVAKVIAALKLNEAPSMGVTFGDASQTPQNPAPLLP